MTVVFDKQRDQFVDRIFNGLGRRYKVTLPRIYIVISTTITLMAYGLVECWDKDAQRNRLVSSAFAYTLDIRYWSEYSSTTVFVEATNSTLSK